MKTMSRLPDGRLDPSATLPRAESQTTPIPSRRLDLQGNRQLIGAKYLQYFIVFYPDLEGASVHNPPEVLPKSKSIQAAYYHTDSVGGLTEEEICEMESDDFLETVYVYIAAGKIATAMDSAIDYIDTLLNDDMFNVCDRLLRKVDFQRMPSSLRRAFLMITLAAKDKIPARAALYQQALKMLSDERGAETAKNMLKTLA
jgi:hypothetical protein